MERLPFASTRRCTSAAQSLASGERQLIALAAPSSRTACARARRGTSNLDLKSSPSRVALDRVLEAVRDPHRPPPHDRDARRPDRLVDAGDHRGRLDDELSRRRRMPRCTRPGPVSTRPRSRNPRRRRRTLRLPRARRGSWPLIPSSSRVCRRCSEVALEVAARPAQSTPRPREAIRTQYLSLRDAVLENSGDDARSASGCACPRRLGRLRGERRAHDGRAAELAELALDAARRSAAARSSPSSSSPRPPRRGRLDRSLPSRSRRGSLGKGRALRRWSAALSAPDGRPRHRRLLE